jgi:hypothetical protein
MSMSTRIDDLPGTHVQEQMPITTPPPPQPPQQYTQQVVEDIYHEKEPSSNITANIKRVTFAPEVEYEEPEQPEGLFTSIKNEINEENVIVLLIIYLATNPSLTAYITKIPFVGIYANDSTLGGFIKAIVLFLVYILFKIFILPRIRI